MQLAAVSVLFHRCQSPRTNDAHHRTSANGVSLRRHAAREAHCHLHHFNPPQLHLAHCTSTAPPVTTAASNQAHACNVACTAGGGSNMPVGCVTCSSGCRPAPRTLALVWQRSRAQSPSRSTYTAARHMQHRLADWQAACALEGQTAHNSVRRRPRPQQAAQSRRLSLGLAPESTHAVTFGHYDGVRQQLVAKTLVNLRAEGA